MSSGYFLCPSSDNLQNLHLVAEGGPLLGETSSILDCDTGAYLTQYLVVNHIGDHTKRRPIPSLRLSTAEIPL